MAKKGLIFLQNEFPKGDEDFTYRQKYRFIPDFGDSVKTIIEVEVYQNNICIISFYELNKGTDKTKYRIRSHKKAGHIKAIFKACLEAYYKLNQDFALLFSATNDLGKIEEDNSRYSAYLLFLSIYFKNYDDYDRKGSIALNTLMIYHRSFQYKEEAERFYGKFEEKVKANLSATEEDSDKP